MAPPPILIAALSGRALAQSARRAGYAPLVVDAFGDVDTRAAAIAVRVLPRALREGFSARSLLSALTALSGEAPSPPVGVVLGAGFDQIPGVIAAVERRWPLLGNGVDAVRRITDPEHIFPRLAELGVACPETGPIPGESGVWLRKRIGGGGGLDVRWADAGEQPSPRDYFQRYVEGSAVSALAVARPGDWRLVGLSQQWTTPTPTRHFRYGGAVGPVRVARKLADRIDDVIRKLQHALDLVGLVSLDFSVTHNDDQPWLLEINARPGATLDVFDDEAGSLFAAHVEMRLNTATASAPFAPPASSFPRRREPRSHHNEGDAEARASSSTRMGAGAPHSYTKLTRDLGSRLRGNDEVRAAAVVTHPELSAPAPARAAAYLYADRGGLTVPAIDWPIWSADRPAAGTRVFHHQPLATALAEGATPAAAEALARERLGLLEEMIYERADTEGKHA